MKKMGMKKDFTIKEFFKSEVEFSKWLSSSEGKEILGSQIGVTLENEKLEDTGSGKFPVDITFEVEVPDEDEPIIICVENQFGTTDHSHFSRLITYAANCNARYAIWIAEEIHPDHKRAVKYLNDHLDESLNIYLFKANMMSIDDSKPILVLDEIVEPDEEIIKYSEKETITELNKIQNKFWFSYIEKCVEKNKQIFAKSKPGPKHWYDVRVGSSKYHITISLSAKREKNIKVGLWISNDIELFNNLKDKKDSIEKDFRHQLDWKNREEAKTRHIWHPIIDDFNIYDESKWDYYIEEIIKNVEKYITIFKQYLNNI